MTTINVDPFVHERIQPQKWCRNGQVPSADYQRMLCELANQIARLHPKELASFGGFPQPSTGHVWRFAAHTSPLVGSLVVRVLMAKSPSTIGPYCDVSILDNTFTTVLANKQVFGGGAIGETPADVPDEWTVQTLVLDARNFQNTSIKGVIQTPIFGAGISPSEYTGRIVSATIYEHPMPADTAYGYLSQGYALGQNIYESDRKGLVQFAINQWKRGLAHQANFSSLTDATAPTNSSATFANIIDNSIAVTTDTAGFYLDLRAGNTKSRTTVPCRFEACFKTTGGASLSVRLVDQNGTVLATLTGNNPVLNWLQTTVNLNPTIAKYDVQHAGNGAQTITTYAASLYRYAA